MTEINITLGKTYLRETLSPMKCSNCKETTQIHRALKNEKDVHLELWEHQK